MKVKELIRDLKKMPQNLEVGFSSHDNTEYEIQGWAGCVEMVVKSDHIETPELKSDIENLSDMPDEWVSIRC